MKAPNHSSVHQQDLELARTVCRELRNGNRRALEPVYRQYAEILRRVVARIAADREVVEDVLQKFWLGLLDGRDICGYEAQQGISLKNYLIRRIVFRTRDANVVTYREQHRQVSLSVLDPGGTETDMVECLAAEMPTPERAIHDSSKAQLLLAALDAFSDHAPDHAQLVFWRMQGMGYDAMAQRLGASGEEEIFRKSAALRKKFTRPLGSLARFSIFLEKFLECRGLKPEDLL